MLNVDNVTYTYKRKIILDQINSTVGYGDSVCIFGPNGAGKSTLLKIMAGLLKANEGTCTLNNRTRSNPIGYIPQDIALHDELTVQENVNLYMKLTKTRQTEFIRDMLSALHLDQVKKKKVKHLSGGNKRKVNLAVGMVHQPSIVFLDEAFVGVDLAAKYDMLTWLKELNTKGMTFVFVSHDWNVIEQLASSMWILQDGKLLATTNMNRLEETIEKVSPLDRSLRQMFDLRRD
ncbi:ABC transporter ATP-binding protein [Halalkalibacillus halophilus]|uniref:ABC transporter ATP-binding protein n=1 Tax=Halalkalibacillus halophilus TaxID=392827 RepID=UPI0004251792|nr:ABC transporter ATP-binding protein [Halalkalibacillus halophilus]